MSAWGAHEMSENYSTDRIERYVQQLTDGQNRLYAYILMLLPNHDDAADVLQETNLVLWRKSGEFVEGTEFGAWACRIAYYQVFARLRDAKRDRLVFDPQLLDQLGAEAEPLERRGGRSPPRPAVVHGPADGAPAGDAPPPLRIRLVDQADRPRTGPIAGRGRHEPLPHPQRTAPVHRKEPRREGIAKSDRNSRGLTVPGEYSESNTSGDC